MSSFFVEVRETLIPGNEGKHGPLPLLLTAMTVVTGLVDAFSYLVLGHVFVANMTGNIVFLGFAFAGASGFSILASLVALGAFALGALVGGALGSRLGLHRGRLLSIAATLQAILLAISVVLALLAGKVTPVGPTAYGYSLIVLLGIAMGLQNATARKLAVPDLTTTVLTLTITGIAADSRIVGGSGSKAGRRLLSVLAMFLGALVGALLIFHVSIAAPLAIAFIIKVGIAVAARLLSRGEPVWVRAG